MTKIFFLLILIMGCGVGAMEEKLEIVNVENPLYKSVLTTSAKEVTFPLSEEIQQFIGLLKDKTIEVNAAGLAAPQVNKPLRIIAIQVTEEARKWRDDVEYLLPLTVLINPSYEIINLDRRTLDWEGCFSVTSEFGKTWRATHIRYQGFDEEGNFVEGQANGFLARLLQHEIDHLNGKLCKEKYPEGGFYGPFEKMREIRMKEIDDKNAKAGIS